MSLDFSFNEARHEHWKPTTLGEAKCVAGTLTESGQMKEKHLIELTVPASIHTCRGSVIKGHTVYITRQRIGLVLRGIVWKDQKIAIRMASEAQVYRYQARVLSADYEQDGLTIVEAEFI